MDTGNHAVQTPPSPTGASTTVPAPDPTIVDTLAYPISPDYVKSCVLICICQVKLLVKSLDFSLACKARVVVTRTR